MKFTKLSLIAAVAVSSMSTVATASEDTTVKGKTQTYYLTTENGTSDLGSNATSSTGAAVTLDVAHKLTDGITANFTAIGYTHLGDDMGANKMEGSNADGFFNVANLTGTFGDNTLVVGRQLLATPMLGGFDWKLAPGAFEAATLVNSSIDKVTLIASYVNRWRANDSGDNFNKLNKNNYAFGAGYDDAVAANLWFYNVDAANYSQVYADVAKTFDNVTVAAQGVKTNYDTATDATALGAKVSGEFAGMSASLAYNKIKDNNTGYVGVDSLYTSSWNTFASGVRGSSDVNAYKVELAKEFGAVSTTASYADYDKGQESDLILGYKASDNVSVDAIYSNTKANATGSTASDAIELAATYTF